jgi:hypothetical protein
MNNREQWERLTFKRERLRVFFWAAKQALLLVMLCVVAIVVMVEAVSNGSISILHQLFALTD